MSKKKPADAKVTEEQEERENAEVLRAEADAEKPEVEKGARTAPKVDDTPKRFEDEARKSIYAKSRTVRDQRIDDDMDERLDLPGKIQHVTLNMASGGASEDEIQAELVKRGYVQAETPEKPADTSAKKPAKGLDKESDTVTIRVDGEDIEVSRDDAIKAGIATLQKDRNADRRQQELSQYERSLKEYEQRLRDNAARGLDANGNPLTPAKADLPDKGVGDAIKEKTAAISKAVFSGDEDGLVSALTEFATSVAQGRGSPTPPLDELVERTAEKVETRQQQKGQAEKAKTVNETFQKDFADLYEDDQKFTLTKAEFSRLRSSQPDADPVGLMREAGETIRKFFKPKDSLEDELARRRDAKGRQPRPSEAAGRVPPPAPGPRPPTRSEAVADMRKARGLS